MDIFDYRVKSNSMPAKCGIQIFHPHPEQTVVICSEFDVISVPRRGGEARERAVNPRWSFLAEEKLRAIAYGSPA